MDSMASYQRITAAERRIQALELRKAGKTYREIGEVLGCCESRAHQIVTGELERLNRERSEAAALVLRLELERLDACVRAIWSQVESGHLGAIDRLLKIIDRRARLLGLDAPTKVAPTDPSGEEEYARMTPEEREERLREILETIRARIPESERNGKGADADQAEPVEPTATEMEEHRNWPDQPRFSGANGTLCR